MHDMVVWRAPYDVGERCPPSIRLDLGDGNQA